MDTKTKTKPKVETFPLQISQYYGHWAEDHPDVSEGRCVKSVVTEDEGDGGDSSEQHWELTTCEALLPFMCRINACPSGTFHCSNGNCVNKEFECDGQGFYLQSFLQLITLCLLVPAASYQGGCLLPEISCCDRDTKKLRGFARQNDCGDGSDELDCPGRCQFHLESSGDIIQSPGYPGKYAALSNCKWTLEGTRGTNIVLQVRMTNYGRFQRMIAGVLFHPDLLP